MLGINEIGVPPPPPQNMGLGIRKQEKIKKFGLEPFLGVPTLRFLKTTFTAGPENSPNP